MAPQSGSDRIWSLTMERKRAELVAMRDALERKRQKKPNSYQAPAIITLDEAIQHQDFESFRTSIRTLAQQFAGRRVPFLMEKYLYPTLDHVRSFRDGIAAVTQSNATAALVWQVLLMVIQCCCVFVESIEDVISQLGAMQEVLPYLEKSLSLYPHDTAIQDCLRKVFESYIDFCSTILKHVSRNPVATLVSTIVSPSLSKTLKKMRDAMKTEVDEFDRAVDLAERSRKIQADDAMMQSQTTQLQLLEQNSATGLRLTQSRAEFPFYHLSIPQNPHFIGRDDEMKRLQGLLQDHIENTPLACTIHGLGGIGKTEVATELAFRCQKMFEVVLWIPADPEQETETLRAFSQIARRLNLLQATDNDDQQVEAVLNWLQNQERRWLVLFDNVVDWKHIARYWPGRSRKNSVIVLTSQKISPWVPPANHLELEPFDDDAGSTFLLEQMRRAELPVDNQAVGIASQVSKELGGSPLYLTHAQGFMKLSGSTLTDYFDIIRTGRTTLDMSSDSTWRYGQAASATHDKLLKELTEGATSLLFMFAFMNPDDIDDNLILDFKEPKLSFLSDRPTYLTFIAELAKGRLVRRTPEKTGYRLQIHRATQAAMLQKLEKNEEQRDLHFQNVVLLLRENFIESSTRMKLMIAEAHVWPQIARILPHLMTAFNYFERQWPNMQGNIQFAQLLSEVAGMDLYDRGRIEECYKINKMVEKILLRLDQTSESTLLADALGMMGLCTDFMALSKRQEGLTIRDKCVTIRENCHKKISPGEVTLEDKIRLHNSYTDLSCSQQQVNDFAGVRRNLELCFEQYKLWGSENEHPYEYSKYYNQMAYVLLYENNSAKAVEFAKKGYELVEQATPGAQMVVLYKFDHANILFQHGDRNRALAILEELLKTCKRDCGKDNVRTLEVRLNIGIMSFFLHDYDKAEKQLRKALDTNNSASWPIENVVRGKYYLSQALKNRGGREDEASNLEKEAERRLLDCLKADTSGKAQEYGKDLPMLYDYLVHWECRLVTPRRTVGQVPTADTDIATSGGVKAT